MKILLLVRSLERGGAERQVVTLARGLRDAGVDVSVAVFYSGGVFEQDLARAGIPLLFTKKSGRWDVLSFAARLANLVRKERPDVLYGFMTTPNLLTVALRPLLPKGCRTVWGIRSSRHRAESYDWLKYLHVHLEERLAHWPDLIIANSQAGVNELGRRGFPAQRVALVRNGIDTDAYQFDSNARHKLREKWSINEDVLLCGIVARADPVKGHEVFLKTAARLADTDSRYCFVCVGIGNEATAGRLRAEAKALNLGTRMRIEGPHDSLAPVYSALDILVMCSHSEGFPNVVAEAMSCGVPCVVTDVGDAVEIIGDTGAFAPPNDPEQLARAIQSVADKLDSGNRDALRASTRARIADRYSILALAKRTLEAIARAGH